MISGSSAGVGYKRIGKAAAKGLAAVLVIVFSFAPAKAQSNGPETRRSRRESNANRRARIARAIHETYSQKWEASAGGGFLRFQSGQFLQQNNEVTFYGETQRALTEKIGILGEVDGAYGNAKIGNNAYLNSFSTGAFKPAISEYTFTAGPSYRVAARERYAATAFVTGGIALGKFDTGSHGFSSTNLGLWQSGYDAAFNAGVNLDYNLYSYLAFRVTPKFAFTTFDDKIQVNRGVNLGVVYRFGHIQ